MEIPRDGMIEIGNTGFRFVRLDLLQNNATISLKEISAILRYRDIPYLGSFECKRPTFKQNMDYRSLYCPLEYAGVFMGWHQT